MLKLKAIVTAERMAGGKKTVFLSVSFTNSIVYVATASKPTP